MCVVEHEIAENATVFYQQCGLVASVIEDVARTKLGVLICTGSCTTGMRVLQTGSDFEACDFTGKNEQYARCAKSIVRARGTMYEIVTRSNHLAQETVS